MNGGEEWKKSQLKSEHKDLSTKKARDDLLQAKSLSSEKSFFSGDVKNAILTVI